jgi:hypothetical protein
VYFLCAWRQIRLARKCFSWQRSLNLKGDCSARRASVFTDYEKLHFELFEDLFFAGNIKSRWGLAMGSYFIMSSPEPKLKIVTNDEVNN